MDNGGIFSLSDRFVDELCALQPALATESGITGYDHEWGDFSPEGVESMADLLTSTRAKVERLDPAADHWDALARRTLLEYLDDHLLAIDEGDPYRDLNNVASSLQTLRETFDLMPTESDDDWRNIVARLSTIDKAIEGYQARLEEGARRGTVVALRQVEAGIHQATAASVPSAFSEILAAYDASGVQGMHDAVAGGVEHARRSFGRLADFLESYRTSAKKRDAVGEERYRRHARSFIGSDPDPRAAYAWGWEEVARLRQEMMHHAHEIDADRSLEEVLELLKHDPARAARDAAELVGLVASIQERALADLQGTHFDVPAPVRNIDVRLAPPGGALGAYYTPPSEDFSRRGAVWYAIEDPTAPVPLYDQISTAYHEGFPGHHLQVGIQVSLQNSLSRFHRLIFWSPGYGEGWALYAELLMDELGYLEKPEYRLGMLAAQMLRACRVVIDIGLHLEIPIPSDAAFHPREAWSPELAAEMLVDWAFLEPPYAVSEVTRYLGWPAQAISYKLGEQAILDLRRDERRRPGFDLKGFHQQVLGSGPVGLDHLREIVADPG